MSKSNFCEVFYFGRNGAKRVGTASAPLLRSRSSDARGQIAWVTTAVVTLPSVPGRPYCATVLTSRWSGDSTEPGQPYDDQSPQRGAYSTQTLTFGCHRMEGDHRGCLRLCSGHRLYVVSACEPGSDVTSDLGEASSTGSTGAASSMLCQHGNLT